MAASAAANIFRRCRDLGPKIQAPSPLPATARNRILADAGFQSVMLEPLNFALDIACGGGIEEALDAAMALGPTSLALQDRVPETRAAVATSIRRALKPINAVSKLLLPGQSGSSPRITPSAWPALAKARALRIFRQKKHPVFCFREENSRGADRGSLTAVPETLRDGRWSEYEHADGRC